MIESNKRPENLEWIRLVYSHVLDEIEYTKRRQWLATNYILLIFGAIIGYLHLFDELISKGMAIFLIISSVLIYFFGRYHILDIHLVLTKNRIKAAKIEKTYKVLETIAAPLGTNTNYTNGYLYTMSIFFLLLMTCGLIMVYFCIVNKIDRSNYFTLDYFMFFFVFDIISILLLIGVKSCYSKNFKKRLDKSWAKLLKNDENL